jgi:hypothetical protein
MKNIFKNEKADPSGSAIHPQLVCRLCSYRTFKLAFMRSVAKRFVAGKTASAQVSRFFRSQRIAFAIAKIDCTLDNQRTVVRYGYIRFRHENHLLS